MTFYHEAGAAADNNRIAPALVSDDFRQGDNLVFRVVVRVARILNQGIGGNNIGVGAVNLAHVHGQEVKTQQKAAARLRATALFSIQ